MAVVQKPVQHRRHGGAVAPSSLPQSSTGRLLVIDEPWRLFRKWSIDRLCLEHSRGWSLLAVALEPLSTFSAHFLHTSPP